MTRLTKCVAAGWRASVLALIAGLGGVLQAPAQAPERAGETWLYTLGVTDTPAAVPDSVVLESVSWTHFCLGLQAELAGDYQEALEYYDRILGAAARDAELLVRRAACHMELDRHGDAVKAARAALEADSLHTEALWVAAAGLAASGKLEGAVAPLRTLIGIRPNERRALSLLAGVLDRLGRHEQLLEPLGTLIDLSPYLLHQRERRAAILVRLGRYEEALDDYLRILALSPEYPALANHMVPLLERLGKRAELLLYYRTVAAARPADRQAQWKVVEILVGDELWEEARAALWRLHEQEPSDGLPLLQLALIDYRTGNLPGAFELIGAAQASGVDPRLVLGWKMRIFFAHAQTDSALAAAGQLIAADSTVVEAWRIQALSLAELSQLEPALASIARWSRLAADDPEPLLLGAAICRELGLWERGLDMMKNASERAPRNANLRLEYAAYLEATDHIDLAAEVLTGLIASEPEHAEALNFLGYMWVDRGLQLTRAEELIRSALRLDPDNPAYIDSMGWLWYKRGDLGQADKWLTRATDKGGRHPEIYRHLAQVKLERGRLAEAREVIRQGLQLNPQDEALHEFIRSLEDLER